MDAIQSNQIEQYKDYFKKLNIEQYGYGVLLNALNENQNQDGFTALDAQDTTFDSIASAQVNIDSAAVQKKMWQDLEYELKAYEKLHPELKGQYVVAINADTEDGQPIATIAKKEDILDLIPQTERDTSEDLIKSNPVQLFKSENLNVLALDSIENRDIEKIVNSFLAKNSGVFQYLAGM